MSNRGDSRKTVFTEARYLFSCAEEKMGRSESSTLARKSWMSGAGYLCDRTGGLFAHSQSSRPRFYSGY